MERWDEWRRRSRRRGYLRLCVSSALVCVLLAALPMVRLIQGQPLSRKFWELGPVLFLVFAGGAALNYWRWKHVDD